MGIKDYLLAIIISLVIFCFHGNDKMRFKKALKIMSKIYPQKKAVGSFRMTRL